MEPIHCFNNLARASQVISWDANAHHFGNGVTLHHVFEYPPPPSTASELNKNITLATQLNDLRVDRLPRLCATWQGFLVAAILYANIENASSPLYFDEESFAPTEHVCHLTVAIFTETYKSRSDAAVLYPVNIMRNYAVALARRYGPGKVVLPIDVDFVPMGDFGWANKVMPGRAYVVPVFESKTPTIDATRCVDKNCIGNLLDREILDCFHCELFKRGHHATPIRPWLDSNEPIFINMELHVGFYEPFIAWIKDDPAILPFHPWFRGRQMDRVFHTVQLYKNGVEFYVAPNSWLIHRSHPRSRRPDIGRLNDKKMIGLYVELRRANNINVEHDPAIDCLLL